MKPFISKLEFRKFLYNRIKLRKHISNDFSIAFLNKKFCLHISTNCYDRYSIYSFSMNPSKNILYICSYWKVITYVCAGESDLLFELVAKSDQKPDFCCICQRNSGPTQLVQTSAMDMTPKLNYGPHKP
jgi:hypothetical protein